ncbi:MAG: BREX-1 system phosphatase PglZ type B [Spirochaetota bacterium]
MRFRDAVTTTVRSQARCNSAVQAAPACILWPDKDRQWLEVIGLLRGDMPELHVLGDYRPEMRTGPAIWLRCALDRALPQDQNPLDSRPLVFYLPGVSRSELRAIASCPIDLAPLAELQYRGVIWSHPNGRDWTPFAFLSSEKGLGLALADDAGTKDALRNALSEFLDQDISRLKGDVLDAAFFHKLVVDSPERELLAWLNEPSLPESKWSTQKREAFEKLSKKMYRFSPKEGGVLEACAHLAAAAGPWEPVWSGFADTPGRYPGIYENLLRLVPPSKGLLIEDHSHYPRVNEEMENKLRMDLLAITELTREKACDRVVRLEETNGERRGWLWASLGHADLARALAFLAEMSRLVSEGGGASNLEGLRSAYEEKYWRCDAAAREALARGKSPKDRSAIQAVLRIIYLPWLEDHSRLMQGFILGSAKSLSEVSAETQPPAYLASDCILFVDGLRYDLGRQLAERIQHLGTISFSARWSALPSVTAVGKYAAAPIGRDIRGLIYDGEPVAATPDGTMLTNSRLATLLVAQGYEVLDGSMTGDPRGKAWDEHGDIDSKGHASGAKLAREIDGLLKDIADRIEELLDAGWRRIHVVTDHGWLLMPGGLPKIALPSAFTQSKWGRTGVLTSAAPCGLPSYQWHLGSAHRLVTAPGAGSFIEGREYSHGGISIQENLLPVITVESTVPSLSSQRIVIKSIRWTHLRCEIRIAGAPDAARIDIRTNAANAATSIANQPKAIQGEQAVLIVPDEGKEGTAVHIVVLDPSGTVLAQETTTVGG